MSVEDKPAVIELGIIIAGPLDPVDRQAVDSVISIAAQLLSDRLPDFDWRLRKVRRDEWTSNSRIEPTDLLQQAREERDEQGWDVAMVITAADLVSHYKPFALAVISRALDVAVISTARVDPRTVAPETHDDERRTQIEARVLRLALHSLGHWLGLVHHTESTNAMCDIESIADLSSGMEFTEEQIGQMRASLIDIADQRLEERADVRGTWVPLFYLLAGWENRREILDAVVQAKPWEFPSRLSRLTTAAVSTVLVLLMTAETWDMAMSQTAITVGGLFFFSITATTAYVAARQQLLLRRNERHVSEQIVTSNVSAACIVAVGMFVMFLFLACVTALAGLLLFPPAVVNGWAASVENDIRWQHYVLMAGTVGSLGILIGALGASFEQQHYFRHVVFVDEEV